MELLTPANADPSALRGATLAVLGYGNQGRAHALNLRDSGYRVVVGQRTGSPNAALARADGFEPLPLAEAAAAGDLLILALPDHAMAEVYRAAIGPGLRPGKALGFVHGFAIRFGRIVPPAGVDVIMVAPKGPGRLLRSAFQAGRGLAAMVAVHQDASGRAADKAVAWAVGLGAHRAAIIRTSFADECEADLFGEQAVLCGGVVELMKAGFDTLVAAGYPAELAYFESIHEVKQIVDLIYDEGLEGMRRRISTTACYGGLTRGPRLVTDALRAELRRILDEVRSGRFADEVSPRTAADRPDLPSRIDAERRHPAVIAGETVRRWTRGAASAAPGDGAAQPPPASS